MLVQNSELLNSVFIWLETKIRGRENWFLGILDTLENIREYRYTKTHMKHGSILIVGAKGTLGQALSDEFTQHGYEVLGWDREELDVTDEQTVKEKITTVSPALLINATANNAVDKIEEDDETFALAQKVNGLAPGYLAAVARELAIPFIHFSTDYVFSGNQNVPYTEDGVPDPISRYGETKLLGEKEVGRVCGQYYIIRLSRLFGKPGISAQSKRSFVDTMIYLVKEMKKERLEVVDDQISSPTYAPDLAMFTRRLYEERQTTGIYHGANSGQCSWFEWAKKIFALTNLTVELVPVPHTNFFRLAKAPAFSVLQNTKLPAQRSWEEALEEYLKLEIGN